MASVEVAAYLVLEDGQVFEGIGVGVSGVTVGLLTVHTCMTGYEALLSEPERVGELLVFTAPHIGNCGRTIGDAQSVPIHAGGLVVRELSRMASNFASKQTITDWLIEEQIVGISEVDTRAVTRYLREHGAMRGAIVHDSFSDSNRATCIAEANHALGLK